MAKYATYTATVHRMGETEAVVTLKGVGAQRGRRYVVRVAPRHTRWEYWWEIGKLRERVRQITGRTMAMAYPTFEIFCSDLNHCLTTKAELPDSTPGRNPSTSRAH